MPVNNNLIKIYDECSNGYHKVDDFRAKLLGFLPLASGIAILGTLYIKKEKGSDYFLSDHHITIGIFGIFVTLGLLVYELKGIEKCTQFIKLGEWIEGQMEDNLVNGKIRVGYFTELLKGNSVINEPVASAFIYSIVLALWTYVSCLKIYPLSYIIAGLVLLISFIFVIIYWRRILKKDWRKG
jgi:hypothetical protein